MLLPELQNGISRHESNISGENHDPRIHSHQMRLEKSRESDQVKLPLIWPHAVAWDWI